MSLELDELFILMLIMWVPVYVILIKYLVIKGPK